jgi:hypothetical protein
MSCSLHDVVKSTDLYPQQYAELRQSNSKIPGYSTAVLRSSFNAGALPPFTGGEHNNAPLNPFNHLMNANNEVSECMEALDALVGLRFAIALMHARKQNHGLIRNR